MDRKPKISSASKDKPKSSTALAMQFESNSQSSSRQSGPGKPKHTPLRAMVVGINDSSASSLPHTSQISSNAGTNPLQMTVNKPVIPKLDLTKTNSTTSWNFERRSGGGGSKGATPVHLPLNTSLKQVYDKTTKTGHSSNSNTDMDPKSKSYKSRYSQEEPPAEQNQRKKEERLQQALDQVKARRQAVV